jgi:predicted alpha/beta-hydrolase family hydrolase
MDVAAPTSLGPGRLVVDAAENPSAVLWLGHGASGGIGATDLAVLAAELPGQGITVARYEQPWRVAGRRVGPRPAALDIAWRETAPLVEQIAGGLPVVVGGRTRGLQDRGIRRCRGGRLPGIPVTPARPPREIQAE